MSMALFRSERPPEEVAERLLAHLTTIINSMTGEGRESRDRPAQTLSLPETGLVIFLEALRNDLASSFSDDWNGRRTKYSREALYEEIRTRRHEFIDDQSMGGVPKDVAVRLKQLTFEGRIGGEDWSFAITGPMRKDRGNSGSRELYLVFDPPNHIAKGDVVANPASSFPRGLPSVVADFVGREKEVEKLVAALARKSDSTVAGVGIVGMPGVGKTQLGLKAAHQLKTLYPDAQLFVDLRGTSQTPLEPEDILQRCLYELGSGRPRKASSEDLQTRYREEVESKSGILFLDDAADRIQIQAAMPPPGWAVLFTSRRRIVLPGFDECNLEPFSRVDARRLLLSICPRIAEPISDDLVSEVSAVRALNASDTADVIAEFCGRLPLALRTAASLLATRIDLSPNLYARQLVSEVTRLERLGKEGAELSVEASFNLSYIRLEENTARVFRAVSVFPADFDRVAEDQICFDYGHAELSKLVELSLVSYDATYDRYRVADLIRIFADARLSETDRADIHRLHALYFSRRIKGALQKSDSDAVSVKLLFEEAANILAGSRWMAEQLGRNILAEQIRDTYSAFFSSVGEALREEAGETLRKSPFTWMRTTVIDGVAVDHKAKSPIRYVERPGSGRSRFVSRSSIADGYLSLFKGSMIEAFRDAALDLAGDPVYVLNEIGNTYSLCDDHELALKFHKRALSLVKDHVSPNRMDILLKCAADSAGLGRSQDYCDFINEGLQRAAEGTEVFGPFLAYSEAADFCYKRSDFRNARILLDGALSHCCDSACERDAKLLVRRGNAFLKLKELGAAKKDFRKAVTILENIPLLEQDHQRVLAHAKQELERMKRAAQAEAPRKARASKRSTASH